MKKKGFTLVELLAVIAILAIIALIALPTINSLIKETRKKSFIDTAYGIIKAGEQYYAKKDLLEDQVVQATFEFPNATSGLEISGKLPTGGSMKVDKNGKISLAISNGRYCVKKGINDTEVTLTEDIEDCELERTLLELATTSATLSVNSVDKCATSGMCEEGTAFAIKVNEEDTYKFYVIKDTGSKVTLIMDRNLGDTVAWYADAADNSHGPITAINYLDELTDDEWSNIPKKPYTYSGIGDDGETRAYEDIRKTMRSRIISFKEAYDLGCGLSDSSYCPSWLVENLYDTSDGEFDESRYWTMTASTIYQYLAWVVDDSEIIHGDNVADISVKDDYHSGVRPVIELSK